MQHANLQAEELIFSVNLKFIGGLLHLMIPIIFSTVLNLNSVKSKYLFTVLNKNFTMKHSPNK